MRLTKFREAFLKYTLTYLKFFILLNYAKVRNAEPIIRTHYRMSVYVNC